MTSQIVTPPDIIAELPVYLLINAPMSDVDLLIRWLQTVEIDYTIHLYNEDMADEQWLAEVASHVKHILISSNTPDSVGTIIANLGKVVWFGSGQLYRSPLEYFIKNG